MSKHFKFDYTKKIEKEMVCTGLDGRTMTHLLDVQDIEWQHIGHEEQLNNLGNQMFQNIMNLVLQMHLEMKNKLIFFMAKFIRVNILSGFDAPARSQAKKPRFTSIVSLAKKTTTYN